MSKFDSLTRSAFSRRSFLKGAAALGATTFVSSAGVLASAKTAFAYIDPNLVTEGDKAILRFLAAAELVEDDLWQQYTELATRNHDYMRELERIDESLPRYISQDRDDERSHANLINAFLVAIGEQPINLDPFRTLPSVYVDGADQVGRLTNLTNLSVDTSWFNRYRSQGNPDFGDTFPQFVNIVNRPTIPTAKGLRRKEVRAIAQSAAFHFAAIEQGGSSLYNSLSTKVTCLDVLAILASIGPTEVYHFSAFHGALEGIAELKFNGLEFPDLKNDPELAQSHFPEPCKFLQADFPLCSVIRPRNTENAGAVAAATGLVNSGLFAGQSQAFFDAVVALAIAADAATRGI